jgi:hypothetical protein
MDSGTRSRVLRPGQFTLGTLLIAVTFVGLACAAAKRLVDLNGSPFQATPQLIVALFLPIFVCGATGVLRGKVRFWLSYGLAVDLFVVAVAGPPIGPSIKLAALLAIPIVLTAAIGAIRGIIGFWLVYRLTIDVAVLCVVLLDQLGR